MLLTKQQIKEAKDLAFEEVEVEEWGGAVRIHVLPSGTTNAFQAKCNKAKTENDLDFLQCFEARFLALCLRDENGDRLFDDNEVGDLAEKSTIIISELFERAIKLNKIGDAELDEMSGNSETGQGTDSDTDSPLPLAGPSPK